MRGRWRIFFFFNRILPYKLKLNFNFNSSLLFYSGAIQRISNTLFIFYKKNILHSYLTAESNLSNLEKEKKQRMRFLYNLLL